MATIFHLALASDWEEARTSGTYLVSTLGTTLAEQGFIHCSRGDQWPRVRAAFYAGVGEPLLLLRIDTDRLDVPVVEEPGVPGGTETFPHIYGPLPVAAVTRAIPLDRPGSPAGTNDAPPVPVPADRPDGTFVEVFFREMLINAALIVLVMVLGVAGVLAGSAIAGPGSGAAYAWAGLGVGLIVGIAAATVLHRRRRAKG